MKTLHLLRSTRSASSVFAPRDPETRELGEQRVRLSESGSPLWVTQEAQP